jgi:hypothetical protein
MASIIGDLIAAVLELAFWAAMEILPTVFYFTALGPIDIHCIQIIAAARWMKPVKLAARLS